MKRHKNWLKTLREKRGLTQDEFAAQLQLSGLDYSRPAVSAWETDRHQPPLQDMAFRHALSNILQIDVKSLLKIAGYEVGQGEHSEEAERVAYLVDRLPKEKRELAVRLVEQLIET